MQSPVISLRAPQDLLNRLDEDAKAEKRSRNYIILEILEQHYNNGNRPQPKKKAGK